MANMTSPYKQAADSPSRQLLWELSQIAISNQQGFYAHLDRENSEREALHRQALAEAAAEHDRVRRSAEHFREQLELQIQLERRKREEAAERELNRQRKEAAAAEAAARERAAERAKTAELEAKKVERAKQAELEAIERQRVDKERRDADAAKRLQEEQNAAIELKERATAAEAKAREAAVTARKTLPAPTPQPSSTLLPSTSSSNAKHEAEHLRYLEIHGKLKELRKYMAAQAKQNSQLKSAMGDMRREIRKNVGQIREGKGTNRNQLKSILDTLKKAASFPDPAVDVTMFLASPPSQSSDQNGPGLLLYLINIFAKAIIAQLVSEAGLKPAMAENVGIITSHIFTYEGFRWQGISLIDILIAKYHVECPLLFGIYGNEQTVQGKERLGWRRDEKDAPFIPEQVHFQRMTGLGAGYAALSLRNYEKVNRINPYPDYHYWQALSRITNVPPNRITQTHFVVLKGLIGGYEEKFLFFYGDAAIVALRHALVELPKRSPPSMAAKALAGLVDVLKRDHKFVL